MGDEANEVGGGLITNPIEFFATFIFPSSLLRIFVRPCFDFPLPPVYSLDKTIAPRTSLPIFSSLPSSSLFSSLLFSSLLFTPLHSSPLLFSSLLLSSPLLSSPPLTPPLLFYTHHSPLLLSLTSRL